MSTTILSQYPFSQMYRRKLEANLGDVPVYISISELRDLPILEIWKRLRSVRGERVLIPIEDENARAVLPFLKLLAGATAARKMEIINSNLSSSAASRWGLVSDVFSVLKASAKGRLAAAAAAKAFEPLLRTSRIPASSPNSKKVLYINANLWFGLKAGGSIGHVAGVVNTLCNLGYEVTYVSAGGNVMVSEKASCLNLHPPHSFGFPLEYNQYVFDQLVAEQVAPLMTNQYAFLYQRMSLGNITGVKLSRQFGLPYILEYNGSEAWAAKNWGKPLTDNDLAVKAEEVCLRHAHVVVTISEVLKEELLSRGVEENRIACYPNCVDEIVFDPGRFSQAQRAELRARYGITSDAVVVGFIGTFGTWHGVDVLAQAIRKLVLENRQWLQQRKVHFLLIGDGSKMPLVKQALAEGESPFWTLTGLIPQPEAPIHLASTDILVSPHVPNPDGTRFFGSPTKLFEYMAMGKAIVASDLDQIGQVLKNSLRTEGLPVGECKGTEGPVALLCRPGNADELVRCIQFVVDFPQWRQLLGHNARREALAKYTWKTHVSEILGKLRAVQEAGI